MPPPAGQGVLRQQHAHLRHADPQLLGLLGLLPLLLLLLLSPWLVW